MLAIAGVSMFFAFDSIISTADAQLFKSWSRPSNPAPVVFTSVPTQAQLLQRLASQTAAVKQVDASVSVAMEGAPKLKGTLQIERPLRLRLKAGVLGVDQMGVDVGSNDDLFWIWTRVPIPGQPPTLMYAWHEQFKRSSGAVRQAIPLEPSWLINALGLVEFSPQDFHEGPTLTPGGRLKLISVSNAPAGRQYRITLIDGATGLIEQQSIYDENRNLVAYTNSTKYKFYPEHNVSLPNKVEMHLYANGQEQKLTVTSAGFNINSLFGDPKRMWTMPDPANVQKIDLSQLGSTGAAPQQQPQLAPPVQRPTTQRPTTQRPASQPAAQPSYQSAQPSPQSPYRNVNARPTSSPYTIAAPNTVSPTNAQPSATQWQPALTAPSRGTPSGFPAVTPRTRLSPLK